MVLKKLAKKDINKAVELNIKTRSPFGRKANSYNKEDIRKYFLDTLNKGKIFGYFKENKLVGCGGIVIDKKHKVGEIRHLFVEKKFQKKGIGREIMKFIENYAKRNKLNRLKLNVLIKNPAVRFFEKLGYRKYVYIMDKKLK